MTKAMENHHQILRRLIHPLIKRISQWNKANLGKSILQSGKGEEFYHPLCLVLCVVWLRLGQLPGKRVRNLLKMQDQRVKKGMVVKKCVSEFACEHFVNVPLCSSSKDEQATSSNPGSGGSILRNCMQCILDLVVRLVWSNTCLMQACCGYRC